MYYHESMDGKSKPVDEKELDIIKLSDAAISEVKRRLQADKAKGIADAIEELGLRLGVKGGGCSGLSYVIKIDKKKEEDHVSFLYGFPIYISPKSGLYLKNTVLDYEGGFMGSGFKFKNPQADSTCGCGESFSV